MMVPCHECRTWISNKARSCPTCGVKPKRTSMGVKILAGFFIFAAVMTAVQEVLPRTAPTPPKPRTPEQAGQDAYDKRVAYAFYASSELRDTMRDPDSYKLITGIVTGSGAICFRYRARNGFGGMNVESLVITPKDRFIHEKADGFVGAWNRYCSGKSGRDIAQGLFS